MRLSLRCVSEGTAPIGWWCWRHLWKPTNVNWRTWVIWKDRWSCWKKITWPTCKTPSAWRKNCAKPTLPVHSWRRTSGRWATHRAESETPRSLSDYTHTHTLRRWAAPLAGDRTKQQNRFIPPVSQLLWSSATLLTDFKGKLLRIYNFWILSLRSKSYTRRWQRRRGGQIIWPLRWRNWKKSTRLWSRRKRCGSLCGVITGILFFTQFW